MKITIEGYLHRDRRVDLELPASGEQVEAAFATLTEGLPRGEGFPYRIIAATGADGPAVLRVKENSDVQEVNLLSYMLENIRQDFRHLALLVANDKSGMDDLSDFTNEVAAAKTGWYDIYDEIPEQQAAGSKVVAGKYIANYDSKPSIYRPEDVKTWLEAERGEYEQKQAAQPGESPQSGMGGQVL